MAFKPGDRVRLKSGGPVMTIEDLDVAEQVICVWFEGTKKKQDRFAIVTLEPASKAGVGAIGVRF